jgi:hypothetical protein
MYMLFSFYSTQASSISGMEYQHRRSTGSCEQFYRRRSKQQREEALELAAARGLQHLSEGWVYSTHPPPAAMRSIGTPSAASIPDMSQLPRRIGGVHPTLVARQGVLDGRFHSTHAKSRADKFSYITKKIPSSYAKVIAV